MFSAFSKEKFVTLSKLSGKEEAKANSVCYYDTSVGKFFSLQKSFGPMDYPSIKPWKNDYLIGSIQSTFHNGRRIEEVYPMSIGDDYLLWFEGSLSEKTSSELKEKLKIETQQETLLLLYQYVRNKSLKEVYGDYSCLLYQKGKMLLFRSETGLLFYDDDLSVSSKEFQGGYPLPPNKIFEMNFKTKRLETISPF